MLKNKRGITLIALIITIIVLLILAGITITMVVGDNGVLSRAKESKEKTRAGQLQERIKLEIANNEIAKYSGEGAKTKEQVVEELKQEGLLTEEEATQLQENDTMIIDGTEIDFGAIKGTIEFNGEKFSAIYTETKEYKENGVVTAWIPKGFAVGKSKGINKVSDGLVITDNQGNQFVWIPVPGKDMTVGTMSIPYTSSSGSEPILVLRDTQANINKYYGTKEDSTTPYFTLETDFELEANYREMAESVNEYGGFYIGRYETTIDSNGKIGSKYNTPILTSNTVIKEGQNSNDSNNPFYYRWWGLYYASRHSNVAENGNTVQTNMIWGQQWDKMISYFTGNSINYNGIDIRNTYDKQQNTVVPSGTARYTPKEGVTDAEEMNDKIFNIYDLRMNAYDWTAEAKSTDYRVKRCGSYNYSVFSASVRNYDYPSSSSSSDCARLTLYIK